ncbi:hypothetical protein Q669_29035 [Labrenzia sp. C1B10]|nr:hypothetical protein Q669_29035 [Labrenzia sp. C1B10]ERS06935.1 hypothetical protein Q675_24895 [Labrenzia sp. C1B70]
MGNLFVERQPLAESPMKDHPLTPMRDSNLMRLLEPQVKHPVGLIDRLTVARGSDAVRGELDSLKAQGIAHIVVDAVATCDLETIAAACKDMPLMTGGSAVAMPLPPLYQADGMLQAFSRAQPPEIDAKTIVLSGSCSAMTQKQVSHYLSLGAPSFKLDPLDLAESGSKNAIDWVTKQDLARAPILYATADPVSVKGAQEILGVSNAGKIIEEALAACAIAARDAGARRVIVAGGETSGAVTKGLGADRLDVGEEIAPGVPWTFCCSGGHQIALALKSGNFGTETFFSDAQTKLAAG